MKKFYLKILIAVMLVFIVSCKTTPAPQVQTDKPQSAGKINITSVSWMIENLDTSIWHGTLKNSGQIFISFFIAYSGSFNTSSVQKLIVESPIDIWTLNAAQLEKITEIDDIKKIAEVKRLQCGDGKGAAALGKWKFILTDTSGNSYEQVMDVTGFEKKAEDKKMEEEAALNNPEKETTEIKKIVPVSSAKNEIAALAMPVIKSVSRDEDSIEIYFSVNDGRVKNGYFWFDIPGEKYYKDSGSMIDASGNPVNGCRVFSTDGKDCYYILRKDSENEEWIDKITGCFFVVSDTNRVSAPWEERNRTVSAFAPVK